MNTRIRDAYKNNLLTQKENEPGKIPLERVLVPGSKNFVEAATALGVAPRILCLLLLMFNVEPVMSKAVAYAEQAFSYSMDKVDWAKVEAGFVAGILRRAPQHPAMVRVHDLLVLKMSGENVEASLADALGDLEDKVSYLWKQTRSRPTPASTLKFTRAMSVVFMSTEPARVAKYAASALGGPPSSQSRANEYALQRESLLALLKRYGRDS